MHRSHDALKKPALSSIRSRRDGLRHRLLPDGFYRGKRVIEKPGRSREPRTSCRSRGSSVPRISDNNKQPRRMPSIAVDVMSGDSGAAGGHPRALPRSPPIRNSSSSWSVPEIMEPALAAAPARFARG